MGKIFVTSDIWFNRPMGPYSDRNIDEYNDTVISNWNNVVGDNDTVYLLGGIGVGDVYDLIITLNGHIVILDSFYTDEEKETSNLLKNHMENSVVGDVKNRIVFSDRQIEVLPESDCVLSYFGLTDWCGKDSGTFCFHGRELKSVFSENNVSCNAIRHNLTPISISDIKDVILTIENVKKGCYI